MDPLLLSGLKLMGVGMGAVFVFLTVLVCCTSLMSYLVQLSSPKTAAPQADSPAGLQTNKSLKDDETIAAIGAAIRKFKNRK